MTMTARRIACALLTFVSFTRAQHAYTDVFPTVDEYDFNVLDAYHIYGSPYGGFQRATRSRLAALPLNLPGSVNEDPKKEEEDRYFQIRDGDGRLFACRPYHQDELEPSSVTASMFDAPVLKKETTADVKDDDEKKEETEKTGTVLTDVAKEDATTSDKDDDFDVEKVLSKLDGVCTQIHRGWWSYEWCYKTRVTQFHIHMEEGSTTQSFRLDDLTSLGTWTTRKVEPIQTIPNGDATAAAATVVVESGSTEKIDFTIQPKKLNFNSVSATPPRPPLAIVTDEFENGDLCAETGLPRKTKVELKCCSLETMKKFKSAVLYKGQPVPSNIAAITSMQEQKTCDYRIHVCTPLLCQGGADDFGEGLLAKRNKAAIKEKPKIKEGASIREILDATISNTCLRHFNGGWWVYELCHGVHVRQFHEADKFDVATGVYSRIPESVHVLGLYSKETLEGFPDKEEEAHLLNLKRDTLQASASSGDGNGVYFVQEYTGGDVCDHSDVTDAAIKAGNVGEGGIERATTVRFGCGSKLEMVRVNEDSTCHYVVDVTIPELCQHAAFKAPVSKKEVIKCLPVEEGANI